MSYLPYASVVVLGLAGGCDSHGSMDPPPPVNETPRFLPLLCTGGTPGAPTCPINHVGLDDFGGTGSLDFVVQTVGSGIYFNRMQFLAGADGLYIEEPTLRVWVKDSTVPIDHVFEVLVNLEPGMAVDPGAAAFTTFDMVGLSFKFTAIGPYRP
jgi:hypothetical protein